MCTGYRRTRPILPYVKLVLSNSFAISNVTNAPSIATRFSLVAGINVTPSSTSSEACRGCDLIITTTCATEPIIQGLERYENVTVIAMGSDTPGKRELGDEVMSKGENKRRRNAIFRICWEREYLTRNVYIQLLKRGKCTVT